jgi:hypothetical protein
MTHPILARHAYIVAALSLRGNSHHLGGPRVVQVANKHQATGGRSPDKGMGLVTAAIREIAVSAGVVAPRV